MYTHKRRVSYSEVSMDGYADVAQIADYFQDCSSFQSDELGIGYEYLTREHLAWLLASWQIIVERYPEYGEEVAVSTWPYDFDSVFGYRNFSLTDVNGNRLAVANSQWILVNTETGHPIRITEEVTSHYPMDEKAEMTYASRKVPFKDAKEEKEKLIVPRAFIDTNQHVNNAQYIRMALEYVPKDFVIAQVRVEFKNAAVLGDSIKPYVYNDGQLIRILLADEQKKPYAVVEFQKKMNGENND